MAIYNTDRDTGEIRRLSNAEIKAQIQALTGWTTKQYQKEYDKLRNKLRNYEATIGQKKPGAVNEELFKIITRLKTTGVNERQQVILNYSSASTAGFKRKAQAGKISDRLEDMAINSLINGTYRGLLNKSETTRREFEEWKKEVVDKVTEIALDGKKTTREITREEAGLTAKDVNEFLSGQAKDLHNRQERQYKNNKAYYDENDSYPGSD